MDNLVAAVPRIPSMTPRAIDKVRQLEGAAACMPQAELLTEHVIHAGLYARTVRLHGGMMITGALVKRSTLLIVQGDALAYIGDDEPLRLQGYVVLPASAGRKQAFVALADTSMTMLFPTAARTIEEAEAEFTDELDILVSRRDPASNYCLITGER